eukprot:PITA_04184
MSRVPYANVVGNLMYMMVSTRPDISHVVEVVIRFMANPGEEHWRVVKWVLRYLRGTCDHCILFNGSEGSVYGYVDVDYVDDLDKRRSTTCHFFTLADASKEAIWLKVLLDEIGRAQDKVNVFYDSQSVIHLATNPSYHNKTKHIYVRYHFLRDVIDDGKLALKKVHTCDNCADIFTKPITIEKLRWCLASLGLQKR